MPPTAPTLASEGLRVAHSRLSLALAMVLKVFGCLAAGLALGIYFPRNPVVLWVAQSGTWFPKTIVTFAAAIIFVLMSAALAKTLLSHARAGRFLSITVALYVLMAAVSLLYVSVWIPTLTGLPLSLPNQPLPGPGAWLHGIAKTFATVLTDQPLLQILVTATLVGALVGSIRALRPAALALIKAAEWLLAGFAKLLWYYPIMIGCLAIWIPSRFGQRGLAIYGRTSLNLAIVAVVWSVLMLLLVRCITKRTWRQIWAYFATVYATGFGTGGSYDTLPVNVLSAERDLGLRPEVARVSIVLGTVLNKNISTMAVLLVTVSTCYLLKLPISMVEIAVLIPPIMILGLETPGIPGGAAVFMSPIIASLLDVPDPALFVTTFITLFSGVIPMFNAAGNTTDDGFVGAILNDCFMNRGDAHELSASPPREDLTPYGMGVRVLSVPASIVGLCMLVAPQAQMGLPALHWMARFTFHGEAIVGSVFLLLGLTGLLGGRKPVDPPLSGTTSVFPT